MDTIRIRLIGPPHIELSDGGRREVRGHKPWAVLARVLMAERPLSRRELAWELFPDADDPLGSLRWCLAGLRKAIGIADALAGDPIRAQLPESVTVDVHQLWGGRCGPEIAGEFLAGVDPSSGPEFAMWLLVTRQQVASLVDANLREAVLAAISRGDHTRAVELAEVAARRSVYDEGPQVLLVKALVMAGHADAALRHIAAVETLYRDELGHEPSPALRSAARTSVASAPPGVPPSAIARSQLEAGRAAIAAGAIEAGLDCLRRAVAQAESTADNRLLGHCLLELGTSLVHAVRGFDDEGSVLLDQAVHLARAAGDGATAVGALRELGYCDTLAGRRLEAERRLQAAAEAAHNDPALLAGVHAVSGLNLADWGRLEAAHHRYATALELARSSGQRRWSGWVLGLGGWAALGAGRTAQARDWLRECLDIVRELQWVSFEPWPVAALAEADLTETSPATSTDVLEHCFAMSCQLEDPCWEGASGRVLALHHAAAGRPELALRWISDARRRAQRRSDTWSGMIGAILLAETEIRASFGDITGAAYAGRELIAYAARAQLDGLLERGLHLPR